MKIWSAYLNKVSQQQQHLIVLDLERRIWLFSSHPLVYCWQIYDALIIVCINSPLMAFCCIPQTVPSIFLVFLTIRVKWKKKCIKMVHDKQVRLMPFESFLRPLVWFFAFQPKSIVFLKDFDSAQNPKRLLNFSFSYQFCSLTSLLSSIFVCFYLKCWRPTDFNFNSQTFKANLILINLRQTNVQRPITYFLNNWSQICVSIYLIKIDTWN
jgi:hypothetical protein